MLNIFSNFALSAFHRSVIMKKLFAFLFSLFALASCRNDHLPPVTKPAESVAADVSYEANELDDAGARADATSVNQSVTFQNISEDLDFVQAYSWQAWHFGLDEPAMTNRFDGSAIDNSGATKRDHPTYMVAKSNLRLFATKSMKAGWYLATNANGSGEYYKFQVVKGQAGLLTMQGENNPPRFNGYTPAFGKVKISMWNAGEAKPGEADFVIGGVNFHLFSRDGLGASKYQTFCLPVGSYPVSYRKTNGQAVTGTITVTATKTVTLKAIF